MNFARFIFGSILFTSFLFGTWFESVPRTLILPDNSILNCFASGDQYFKRLHDSNDFTLVMNQDDGYYYYAVLFDGNLVPSEVKVGEADPESVGIYPGAKISNEIYQERVNYYKSNGSERDSRDAPTTGTINQINIFIRFADDPNFSEPRSYYDGFYQSQDNIPSLRNYFKEISYNTLDIITYHYPGSILDLNTSYVDDNNRNYYEPVSANNPEGYQSDNDRMQREHTLLANAVNAVSSQIPNDLSIDSDNDGYVDAVSFVIYGSTNDWSDLLWPHRWSLYSQDVFINDAMVRDYLFMLTDLSYFNVGVLCHEFFHVLGAPDLYHYDRDNGAPRAVGGWDLMDIAFSTPQYPSAYMKWKYGNWIEMESITTGGTYIINPLQKQENVLFKILSPFSPTEYFVIEYRKKDGLYETNTPGNRSGLLVYRINENAGDGNQDGPPDEIYLYRPNGTLISDGNFNFAPFSLDYGSTEINDNTNPNSFLYNDGFGGDGGLNVYNISGSDTTMSFTVSFGNPIMEVNPQQLDFILSPGEFAGQQITVSNMSEINTFISYEISNSTILPFANVQGGPDLGNYFWTSSGNAGGIEFEWNENIDGWQQLVFPHNDEFSTQQIQLPFDFPFYGELYNYVYVNANGWIGWTDQNETAWENSNLPSAEAPRPAIFGFWDDLNPINNNSNQTAGGNVYYFSDSSMAVIWYNNVARWLPGGNEEYSGLYDFQIVLHSSGDFGVNYASMDGVVSSATVGFQNSSGDIASQIVNDSIFVNDQLSWKAAKIDTQIPWMIISTEENDLSGSLQTGESRNIYVQAISSGLEPGEYAAALHIISNEVDPVSVPINLTVSGQVPSPVLPYINIDNSDNGIVQLPENIDSLFKEVADYYTHVDTPDGDIIPILAQENFSQSQIIHVRDVLNSLLKDVPGASFGNDKSNISNAIGASNAIIFLLNDESEYENSSLLNLYEFGVGGQDLLATEVFPETSNEYIQSSRRNATYEEVLHFVHNYGIKIAEPYMQNLIVEAMQTAIENQVYAPLNDISPDDYADEYFALGLECFYGIWAHDPNSDGFSGDREYSFINRLQMEQGDPALYRIISEYFGETWNYTPKLNLMMGASFSMQPDTSLDYTFRSQYLRNITAVGNSDLSIAGNNYSNVITGNSGDNTIAPFSGSDTLFGGGGNDKAIFQGPWEQYFIEPILDSNSFRIIDVMYQRDGLNILHDFEEFEFAGDLFSIGNLLSNLEQKNFPDQFNLYAPYPNPFNSVVNLEYDIPKESSFSIIIFDLKGRQVFEVYNGKSGPGKYAAKWMGRDTFGADAPAGMYLVQFRTNEYLKTHKVLLLK